MYSTIYKVVRITLTPFPSQQKLSTERNICFFQFMIIIVARPESEFSVETIHGRLSLDLPSTGTGLQELTSTNLTQLAKLVTIPFCLCNSECVLTLSLLVFTLLLIETCIAKIIKANACSLNMKHEVMPTHLAIEEDVLFCIDSGEKVGVKPEPIEQLDPVGKKPREPPDDELDEVLASQLGDGRWLNTHGTHLSIFTVVEYPENQNPHMSLSVLQQLDAMTPREFLTHVLCELTLEERESLMLDEGQRRKTFLVGWQHRDQLSGVKMAQAGFYYLDDSDRVQCVFCRGRLHGWKEEDNPMVEHARSFTFCRFIKGLPCNNREYRSSQLSGEDMVNITAFGNLASNGRRQAKSNQLDSISLGVCTNRAAVARFAPESARLRTFNKWPARNTVSARSLCDAGFYYTGFGDHVRCFFCAGGIKDWIASDSPWVEHARWFPDCSYLLNQKGREYVETIHQNTPENKKSPRKTISQIKSERKQATVRSIQDEMKRYCEKLGHSKSVIDQVTANRDRPYEDIKEMIDDIHRVEDEDINESISGLPMTSNQLDATEDAGAAKPKERDQSAASNQNQTQSTNCKVCSNAPAVHVALPCGHLAFCGSCNAEEVKKSSTEKTKCPTADCHVSLAASIRVYFG